MAFNGYSDKRGALRGLTRHLGAATNVNPDLDLNALLEQVDGKWGFDTDKADAAVGLADVTEEDEGLILMCGHSNCPGCDVHLSNGLSDFDGMVERHGSEKAAYKHQQKEWACLGCGHQFGKDIEVQGSKARGEPTRHYINKSTIDNAVQFCHDLFSGLPEETRRKDAIQAAVDNGIAFYTARTQYQKWHKARRTK